MTDRENVSVQDCDQEYFALLAKINGDPRNYREAMCATDASQWKEAADLEINALINKKVFRVVKRPILDSNGKKLNIIDSRWLFKRKGEKRKARLVTRGDKDKNFYNLRETYALVSKIENTRALLAFANKYNLKLLRSDVDTAFLNSDLKDEIYMEIPDGMNYLEQEKRENVLLLEKSIYGLRTSPKSWNKLFTEIMIKLGFKVSEADPCICLFYEKDTFVIVTVYVDDIIEIGNNETKMLEIQNKIQSFVRLKELGSPKNSLGINIERHEEKGALRLSQIEFIDSMLKRFGYENAKPISTPMCTTQVLNKQRRDREEETSDENSYEVTRYRQAIGSLLYLANCTRPDISYAVNVLSRHQLNLTEFEWDMLERVFRYLIGKKGLKVTYKGETDTLEGYLDASLADCKGSLTTCGVLVQLFDWLAHSQTKIRSFVDVPSRVLSNE